MLWTILLFLAILSILVLAHEFGHYIVARKSGMAVEEFGIGFPPRLFAVKGKRGMLWTVNAIPLGGFVRIKGESGDDAERNAPDSFARQPLLKRFFVLIAGVAMNLVAAAVIFSVGFAVGIPMVTEEPIAGAIVENSAVAVLEIVDGSPAEEAGFMLGDRILSVDGVAYDDSDATRTALSVPEGEAVDVTVARGKETVTLTVAPEFSQEAQRPQIGIAIVETGTVRFPWYLAPGKGIEAMVSSTISVGAAFVNLFASIFTADRVDAELAGPIGIAVMTGEVAKLGFGHLLQFAAMLSINLAILNVLPIPALDGGRMLFLAIEAIRRKPVTARIEQMVHGAGFALLMLLVLVVTFKDIVNLF